MSEPDQQLQVVVDESAELDLAEGDRVTVVDVDERAESDPSSAALSYFGTDFDVHGLVRRLREGDILIPTFDPSFTENGNLKGFQRQFVWRRYQMDRFVESLLLGYPVPGIFLVQQPDRKLLVLDGQQRLKTLEMFYSGEFVSGQEFKLEAVSDDFRGLTYESLSEEDRRQLDNTFIHAIVVKHDPDAQGGSEGVYQLFERLNTGGTNLYPQEIRVALYPGVFVDFVRDLNRDPAWRQLYGPPSGRLKDQELILRILAMLIEGRSYSRPLKTFLNEFLKEHRQGEGLALHDLRDLFVATADLVNEAVGKRAFRTATAVNAALVDAIMTGTASRLGQGPVSDLSEFARAYDALVSNEDFQWAIERATADEDRVERRLRMANEAFANVR